MPVMIKCRKPGCHDRRSSMRYKGKEYCSKHYHEILEGEFVSLYNRWIPIAQPEKALRAMMGRMLDEVWRIEDGMLTKARLRDRAFKFKKSGKRFTFEITRHPRAFKNGYVDKRVVQQWQVDVTCGRAVMESERDWQPGDFDGNGVGYE